MSTMQLAGLTRTDLQRHDVGIAGWEAIQNRVDIAADAPAVRHKHPGEEIIYVLGGSLRYDVDGEQPRTVGEGEVLTIPAETFHSVTNVGDGSAAELATYIVPKDKPLLVIA